MRHFSSIINLTRLGFFEEISHIAEISSTSGAPRPVDEKLIEENCMWQEFSSIKNSSRTAISRNTACIRKYPRKHGFMAARSQQ